MDLRDASASKNVASRIYALIWAKSLRMSGLGGGGCQPNLGNVWILGTYGMASSPQLVHLILEAQSFASLLVMGKESHFLDTIHRIRSIEYTIQSSKCKIKIYIHRETREYSLVLCCCNLASCQHQAAPSLSHLGHHHYHAF